MKIIKLYVLPVFCIAVIGSLLYANSIGNVFVLDDFLTIKENESIRLLSNIPYFLKSYFRRSIFYISLTINYYFCKLNPAGYHLVNIAIHILNSIILYLFLLILCRKRIFLSSLFYYAFIPSIIFLIHPIQANTINHIATRSITLCTLFYLLSLIFYVSGRESSKKNVKFTYYLLTFTSFLLCVGSKSIGFTVPIVIFIINKFFYSGENLSYFKWKKADILLFVLCGLFMAMIIYYGDVWQADYHSMINNLLTQTEVVARYVILMLFPVGIVPEYNIPIKDGIDFNFIFWLIVIMIIIYHALKNFRKKILFSFSVVFYFITIAPSSSIIPRTVTMLMYRTYLPIIGFCIFCGYLMRMLMQKCSKKIVQFCLASLYFLILVVICGITIYQNNLYNSNINLWKRVNEKFPDNPVSYFNIGTFLLKSNQIDEAIYNLEKSIELEKLYAKAHFHLGLAYQMKGMTEDAIKEYKTALSIKPYSMLMDVNFGIYLNLGNAYFEKKDFTNAANYYNKYIIEYRARPDVLNNLYHAYKAGGDYSNALSIINRAIMMDGENILYLLNRADLLVEMGEWERAENAYKEILLMKPKDPRGLFKLGLLYQQTDRYDQALETYELLLNISKIHVGALNNSGVIFYNKGDIEKAIELWNKILEIEPNHKGARENLNRLKK